jgi:hypothetical protein
MAIPGKLTIGASGTPNPSNLFTFWSGGFDSGEDKRATNLSKLPKPAGSPVEDKGNP